MGAEACAFSVSVGIMGLFVWYYLLDLASMIPHGFVDFLSTFIPLVWIFLPYLVFLTPVHPLRSHIDVPHDSRTQPILAKQVA